MTAATVEFPLADLVALVKAIEELALGLADEYGGARGGATGGKRGGGMNEQERVYVVTKGSYSAYEIIAIFDDETLANEAAARLTIDTYNDRTRVEVYPLNPCAAEFRVGLSPYEVGMDFLGNVESVERVMDLEPGNHEFYGWSSFGVWARDEEHARKIAGERWARLKHDGARSFG